MHLSIARATAAIIWLALALGAVSALPAKAQKSDAKIYLSTEEIEEISKGTACRNLVKQFFDLQKRMGADGLESDFYDLKIISTAELVAGKKGRYYVLYLKNAADRARFKFPGGRYVISEFETRFRGALSAFVRETLAIIEGGADYELYVRGGSSSTPMSIPRTLVEGRAYTSISYLPKIRDNLYAEEATGTRAVPNAYTNEDLPFLRAAFLKDVVKEFYPLKDPVVLESEVASSDDTSEQFAEILLFVDW